MDRTLRISLFISFFAHALLVIPISNINLLRQLQSPLPIEVTYHKIKNDSPNIQKDLLTKNNLGFKNSQLKTIPPFVLKREMSVPDFIKEDLLANKESELKKTTLVKTDAVKKKVTVPVMESTNIKSPVYKSYSRSIRGKITYYAHKNYNGSEEGFVYVTFVISADGQLKEVIILDEESRGSSFLKDIVVKSIKDASPYPPFPKDFGSPQISFKVIVSFELE